MTPSLLLLLLTAALLVLAVSAAAFFWHRTRRAAVALTERERLYRFVLESSSELIMIADLGGRIEYVSSAAQPVLGAEGSGLVGRSAGQVLGLAEGDLEAAVAAATQGTPQQLDCKLTRADGLHSFELALSVYGSAAVLIVRDVTERARFRQQLLDMASHDPLTGLCNRARVLQSLDARMASWRADGGAGPALLFLDLDGFKGVNDVAGHAAGDQVLRLVASRLAEITPGEYVLGRLEGDEFVVLLPAVAADDALAEAERIAEQVSQSYQVEEGTFVIRVSIGVAHAGDAEDAEDLLRNADLAMYAAKRSYRAAQAFDPSMHSAAVLRADSDRVHAAVLDERRTELHYQPIFPLDAVVPVGVEALLTWRTEDGALRQPGPLLEYAQRSGRIGALSQWVIATALDQVADWRQELGLMPVSVNLAPVDLLRRGLVRTLRDELAARGLPPGVLTIEITEQVLMQDPDRAIRVITDLRSLGIRVSIDDFGTGFSSLAYLVDLPVDALKIDASFIQALPRTKTARVVVAAIIDVARELGMAVVAEGIESVEQRELLSQLGDPLCQGYLFSPPLPAQQVAALVVAGRHPRPLERDAV